jgi:sugar phosphate permease
VIGVPLVAFYREIRLAVGLGITALLSLAYFAAYWMMYRDPSQDNRLSKAEHDYILAGGAVPEGLPPAGQVRMLGYILRNRKVWAHTIGYSAYGYSFYLFLTWLPGYMVQTLHMSILKSAAFSTIPWGFATLADLLIGGFLVDALIAQGLDDNKVRKAVIVTGMLAGWPCSGSFTLPIPFGA